MAGHEGGGAGAWIGSTYFHVASVHRFLLCNQAMLPPPIPRHNSSFRQHTSASQCSTAGSEGEGEVPLVSGGSQGTGEEERVSQGTEEKTSLNKSISLEDEAARLTIEVRRGAT